MLVFQSFSFTQTAFTPRFTFSPSSMTYSLGVYFFSLILPLNCLFCPQYCTIILFSLKDQGCPQVRFGSDDSGCLTSLGYIVTSCLNRQRQISGYSIFLVVLLGSITFEISFFDKLNISSPPHPPSHSN